MKETPNPLGYIKDPIELKELERIEGFVSNIALQIHLKPQVRLLRLRKDTELRFNTTKENIESALAQTRWIEAATPCDRCARTPPCGPYLFCVRLPGFFDGACANCRYNSCGSRCSFPWYVILDIIDNTFCKKN